MSTEDIYHWDRRCVVCDKYLETGGELCHLNVEGEMLAICCPLCLEAFEKESVKYLRRRKDRKLADQTRPPGAIGSSQF